MAVRVRFAIVALLFIISAYLVFLVFAARTGFWLLGVGFVGVAVFGPWSYYLYAKMKLPKRPTEDEIVQSEQIKASMREK